MPTVRDISFTIGVAASVNLTRVIRQMVEEFPSAQMESMSVAALCSRRSSGISPNLIAIEATNEGADLLSAFPSILQRHPHAAVIAISDVPDHRAAVRLIQAGIKDFIILPQEQHRLYDLTDKMVRDLNVRFDQATFVDAQVQSYDFSRLVGSSPLFMATISRAQKVAGNNALTVLILGETGTGKGMLAKAIHYNSANRTHPFVEIGCSALPETLLESELFGHEKGAFTDARERKIGLFELAGQGTIFLDEIGDISPAVQSKLLKVLEEKQMRRVGGVQDIRVAARIIAATSRDLADLVRRGVFRSDLYYRLNVVPLVLPPLRERQDDIPPLINHFLARFGEIMGDHPPQLTTAAREKLMGHQWEGNVRELMHALERAVVLAEDSIIDAEDVDLSTHAQRPIAAIHSSTVPSSEYQSEDQITLRLPIHEATIAETEKHLVRELLRHVQGNKSRAAAMLQISRPRLERIIKQDREFFKSVLK